MNHPNRSKQQQPTHTPGPWFSKRRGTQGAANYAVIETAANWHTEIARVYFGDRFVNGEANARLIAAAPELLAALKTLYSEFKAYRPDCFEGAERAKLDSPDMIVDKDGSLRMMRGSTVVIVLGALRAIAKAEGR